LDGGPVSPPGYGGPGPSGEMTDGCIQAKGGHGYPYKPELHVYLFEDLLKVLDGGAASYTPAPIQRIVLPNFRSPVCGKVVGATLSGNRLYVMEEDAAKTLPSSQYTDINVLHSYTLKLGN
jgi:hypothetical protein